MEREASVEILFQKIEKTGEVTLYESVLAFTPFSQMCGELSLTVTKDTYEPECDWYLIYAVKTR